MLSERFIELLTKQLSSEINDDERNEFQQFLDSDKLCQQYYETFKDYWKQEDQGYANSKLLFEKIKTRISVIEEIEVEAQLLVRKIRIAWWPKVAAAVLIGVCCLVLYKWQTYTKKEHTNNITGFESTSTKPQTRSIITLTDGTRVTLNSESTLKYPAFFTGETREVYLSGEAFFDVHKDHSHPFIIHTNKMNIKVLGTAFNVKAYPTDITSETTLIRGIIEITLNDRPSDRIVLKPKEKLILENGQRHEDKSVQYKADAGNNASTQQILTTLTYFKDEDTSVVETSWLKNKLMFRNEDFTTLAERMGRWYGINIIFENDEVKQYRFNGIFEKETINQALDALRITEKFQYKIDKSNVYIY